MPTDQTLQLAYIYTRGLPTKEAYPVWMHVWNGGELRKCPKCGLITIVKKPGETPPQAQEPR